MTGQDMFAFQLDLLRGEIDEIHSTIATYDDLSFKIKGWSLTLWIGILGFALNQRSPLFSLMAIPVLVAFWMLDAYFKSYQQRSMARMGYIEKFINGKPNHAVGGLVEAFQKRSFGSFVVHDPIGRQTCRVDKEFKEHFQKKTSLRRCFWNKNVRLLYLFLIGSSLLAVIAMLLLGSTGKGA